ncbi:MAG: dCTP deaminase [Nitrososphaeria archaeon]|nr:dCTP deaminase [Aigarchaeota archaeon]MCX8187412.1 dCTP deaminase [Nitrososphaeria archaeon]MDW8021345.1 dCTP deaminase [Nitrososphaerota archaeon]
MILTDRDIREFMRLGKIRFEPEIEPDQIGPGSVDLTLSNRFWRFNDDIDLIDLVEMRFEDVVEEIQSDEMIIPPHGIILGMTAEKVYVDEDVCGWIEGRSRYARMGLAIHSASGFIHPGSYNRQILEISNMTPHPIKLRAGMRIVQVVFQLTRSRTDKPYRIHGRIARDQ